MAKQSTANWQTIDPASLPADAQKAYAAYKAIYAEMKEQRSAFEASVTALVKPATGTKLVFGYNFGKLSVAVVEDDAKPAAKTSALSLSSWLKSEQSAGRRT